MSTLTLPYCQSVRFGKPYGMCSRFPARNTSRQRLRRIERNVAARGTSLFLDCFFTRLVATPSCKGKPFPVADDVRQFFHAVYDVGMVVPKFFGFVKHVVLYLLQQTGKPFSQFSLWDEQFFPGIAAHEHDLSLFHIPGADFQADWDAAHFILVKLPARTQI